MPTSESEKPNNQRAGESCEGIRLLFDYFNRRCFEEELQPPTFTVASRLKTVLRFYPEREIKIGRNFPESDDLVIKIQLLQEMIHFCNFQRGISDSNDNHYHNRNFADLAKSLGFYIKTTPKFGWSLISIEPLSGDASNLMCPSKKRRNLLIKILEGDPVEGWSLDSLREDVLDKCKEPRTVYQMKFACKCPPPYNTIRSGRHPNGKHPLRAFCQDCQSEFILSRENDRGD